MSTDTFPLKWPAGWPRTSASRRRSSHTFGRNLTGYRAHSRLDEELRRLGAQYIVVSSNVAVTKSTGYVGAAAESRIEDPGIALYFSLGGREMSMAQDLFDSPAGNIRSLGIAIEAMRAIERHGGGVMMQRSFAGFAALPPPEGHSSAPRRPWREVLEVGSIDPLPKDAQLAIAEAFYKREARKSHPDSPGGSAQAMAELNVAIDAARQELA